MFGTEHLLVVLPKFPLYFHKPIGAIFVVVLKMWYLLFSSVREYIWNAFGTLNAMCNLMFSLTIVHIVRLPMSYNVFWRTMYETDRESKNDPQHCTKDTWYSSQVYLRFLCFSNKRDNNC